MPGIVSLPPMTRRSRRISETALHAPAPTAPRPRSRPPRDRSRSSTSAASSRSRSPAAYASSTSTPNCCRTIRPTTSFSSAEDARHHPVRRSPFRTTRMPQARPGRLVRASQPRHLLWRPADGAGARGDVLATESASTGRQACSSTSMMACSGGLEREQPVWDEPRRLDHATAGRLRLHGPDGFHAVRRARVAAATSVAGIQRSTPRSPTHRGGKDVLRNFVQGIAGIEPRWTPQPSRPPWPRSATASIGMPATRPPTCSYLCTVGQRPGRRGGFAHRAVGDGLTCIYVDHGLMRKKESEPLRLDVRAEPRDAARDGRCAGAGSCASRRGRGSRGRSGRIIGDEFIRVFEEEAAVLGHGSTSSRRHALPRRHRERDRRDQGRPGRSRPTTTSGAAGRPVPVVIEPLRYLFKDEVRKVGLELGPPEAMVLRPAVPRTSLAHPDHR